MEGVEDQDDNVTRFVWIAPARTVPEGAGAWKTSLVFSELGADHPGALVDALGEFSSRGINLTRIESRPLRQGLGRYMFFCDLQGRETDATVAEAIERLRTKADSVRILGSYPLS
jgi:prephenate dehydratase